MLFYCEAPAIQLCERDPDGLWPEMILLTEPEAKAGGEGAAEAGGGGLLEP